MRFSLSFCLTRALGAAGVLAVGSLAGCSAAPDDVTGAGQAGGAGGAGASAGGGHGGQGGKGGTEAAGGEGGAGSAGGFGGAGPTGAGGGLASPCEDEAKLFIYVLGVNRTLSRFDPKEETLTYMGKIMCPTEDLPWANSMAVDRLGRAYVNYAGGPMFRVDTKTMLCEPLPDYVPCQHEFCQVGMAFVADTPGAEEETLHIAAYNNGLGTLDTETFEVSPIDYFSEMNGVAVDLTGTADGKLFAFFNWTPPTVSEVDKATGSILTKMVPALTIGSSLAFSQWGGRFYLFADQGIWKFDPATNVTTKIMENVGFKISGAGASTCAPTEVPE